MTHEQRDRAKIMRTMGNYGCGFWTIPQLAKETGLGAEVVSEHLAQLQRIGWVRSCVALTAIGYQALDGEPMPEAPAVVYDGEDGS